MNKLFIYLLKYIFYSYLCTFLAGMDQNEQTLSLSKYFKVFNYNLIFIHFCSHVATVELLVDSIEQSLYKSVYFVCCISLFCFILFIVLLCTEYTMF